MEITITKQNFSKIIFNSTTPVLLTFYRANEEISKKQDFFLHLFSSQNPTVIIGKINTEKDPSLAALYGIHTFPSIKIFKKGKCTATAVGLQDPIHLSRLIIQ